LPPDIVGEQHSPYLSVRPIKKVHARIKTVLKDLAISQLTRPASTFEAQGCSMSNATGIAMPGRFRPWALMGVHSLVVFVPDPRAAGIGVPPAILRAWPSVPVLFIIMVSPSVLCRRVATAPAASFGRRLVARKRPERVLSGGTCRFARGRLQQMKYQEHSIDLSPAQGSIGIKIGTGNPRRDAAKVF
jgi:hypothetical protein